jgi:hypothetical protein
VSLMTKTQATRGKAAGRTAIARRQARRAAAQATPLAASAAATTRRGVYTARTWAAPRLERAGHALERRVAPKMATMLSAAARRVDPAPRKRRRWPVVAAGLVAAAGLSATAAYLMNRRGPGYTPAEPFIPESTTPEPVPEPAAEPDAATAPSDVNGRVHTS